MERATTRTLFPGSEDWSTGVFRDGRPVATVWDTGGTYLLEEGDSLREFSVFSEALREGLRVAECRTS